MKRIEAIIRKTKFEEVKEALDLCRNLTEEERGYYDGFCIDAFLYYGVIVAGTVRYPLGCPSS